MKFPYAISDFYNLITEDYLYIDRSHYITLLEEGWKYPLFLRPRRFGKSLLISMLKNYYDIAKADEFERLFGHLAIGKKPTSKHNQYMVLKFDFSMVSPHGNTEQIQQALYDHINETIKLFIQYYQPLIQTNSTIYPHNGVASIQALFKAVQKTPYKLYILIDEYDNFANEVMMGRGDTDPTRYQALVHGEGCLKSVLKVIKGGTEGLGVDRVFITGVSPIAMSDVTSGFNIAENIFLDRRFNDMCGFTEEEITNILEQVVTECNLPLTEVTKALNMMRSFYNGYAFTHNTKPTIYNPTLALYFLKHLNEFCEYPPNMLDQNLATDRNKLIYVSKLPDGETLISQALDEKTPPAIFALSDRFGVADMFSNTKDTAFIASLLYFLGMLTMAGRDYTGKHILQIPNLVARKLYLERLQEILIPNLNKTEIQAITTEFYSTANMQTLCEFIERTYLTVFDNRDYRWTKELTIKTIFLTILYNDAVYIMDSEIPLRPGYADLTMIIRPDMRQYQLLDFLLEFKYIDLSTFGVSGATLKEMPLSGLMALDIVKEKLKEAEASLQKYHATLQTKYHNTLRLRSFSIIALGFERLLWVEFQP